MQDFVDQEIGLWLSGQVSVLQEGHMMLELSAC